jgi:hypothetical protein
MRPPPFFAAPPLLAACGSGEFPQPASQNIDIAKISTVQTARLPAAGVKAFDLDSFGVNSKGRKIRVNGFVGISFNIRILFCPLKGQDRKA